MGAHGSRLLGDGSFGHPGQILKWMDLRVSPILYKLFDQCERGTCIKGLFGPL